MDVTAAETMVSENFNETLNKQTSVAITSAWALKGSVVPSELLTRHRDTLPSNAKMVAGHQNGPYQISGGARLTTHISYSVENRQLIGSSQYDIPLPSEDNLAADAVLVQRIFNSPVDGQKPKATDLSDSTVRVLCSVTGGQSPS